MQLFFRILFKIEKMMIQEKEKQLKRQIKYCGQNVRIDKTCHILVPEHFEIGDNSSVSSFTTIFSTFGVKIGKNCLISSNCGISSYNHIQNSLSRPAHTALDVHFSKAVTIGDNVWIGMNTTILPGIVIGQNAIIGAGSVVTKNVPANEIWIGNPARFVKSLNFNEQ